MSARSALSESCCFLIPEADEAFVKSVSTHTHFFYVQFDFFDETYMGLRPFELVVEVKDSSKTIIDYEVLKQMHKIDSFLVTAYGLDQVFSIISVLKIANRSEHGGQTKYYKLPSEKQSDKFSEPLEDLRYTNKYIDNLERENDPWI